ncbi:MAG: hypothetical protein OXL40_08785 [Bacteroidota bacterium]|nr:hypothetical protein [Bacteroidota bacterium]
MDKEALNDNWFDDGSAELSTKQASLMQITSNRTSNLVGYDQSTSGAVNFAGRMLLGTRQQYRGATGAGRPEAAEGLIGADVKGTRIRRILRRRIFCGSLPL